MKTGHVEALVTTNETTANSLISVFVSQEDLRILYERGEYGIEIYFKPVSHRSSLLEPFFIVKTEFTMQILGFRAFDAFLRREIHDETR